MFSSFFDVVNEIVNFYSKIIKLFGNMFPGIDLMNVEDKFSL